MEELLRSLQIQKAYLSNINQQLIKPEYKNELMFNLKKEVEQEIAKLQFILLGHDLKIKVIEMFMSNLLPKPIRYFNNEQRGLYDEKRIALVRN